MSGIGPKLAVTVLSGLASADLIAAIRAGEVNRLVRIPGVGKKTAERMVLELRDKLPASAEAAAVAAPGARAALTALDQDVLSALLNLGCARPAAEAAVRKAKAAGLTAISSRSSAGRSNWCGKLEGHAGTGIVSAAAQEEELQFEASLRPRRLADFTGQTKLKENLSIAIEAARLRGEAMDHVLLYGPPGLGKTTLASIIADELGVGFEQTSGPGAAEETRPHRHPQQHPRAAGLLHRRDPPADAGRRGDAVLGAGGFPRRHPGGRRPGRAHALAADAAVHRDRRDHAPGSGERSAARPLRAGAAAESLRGGGTDSHRGAVGEAAAGDHR